MKLMLAAQLDGVWAEEVLRDGTSHLTATCLGNLTFLATGNRKKGDDAASRRREEELSRNQRPT